MSSASDNNNDNTAPAAPKPSEKQMNLLALIMQNVQGKPDINVSCKPHPFLHKAFLLLHLRLQGSEELTIFAMQWTNVVEQSGLKNERVAKEMYRQMTKKFGWGPAAPSESTGGAATATATASKVQKRAGKVGSKSTKKTPSKNKAKDENEEDDEV